MIMFTTKMCQLAAIVLEQDVDNVTKELLKQGVLHFVKVTEVAENSGNYLANVSPKVPQSKIADTRRRIDSFFNIVEHNPVDVKDLDVSKLSPVDIEECNNELDSVASGLQKMRDKQKNIQQEIHKLEEIKRQLALFDSLGENIETGNKYAFLSIQTGKLHYSKEEEFINSFQSVPSVQIKLGQQAEIITILLITMKRDSLRVEKLLQKFEWEEMDVSGNIDNLGINAKSEIDEKINNLKIKQEETANEAKEFILARKDFLEDMWSNLRMNELFYKMQSFYSKTSRTMLFSGWLPASKKDSLESAILKVTDKRCYLEWSDPQEIKKINKKDPDVPVKMKNPKLLSPFEMLVTNYAIPQYGTIDPTPIVAVAYLIMFGLMFGDAGHGFVIALIGLFGIFMTRKESGSGTNKLFQLMIWCGASAIITGILFGSYFGHKWFNPVWFDYHGIIAGHAGPGLITDISGILLVTIYFGITVIGLGLILNWINCISKGNWFRLFLDKGGLLGGWMYGAGTYVAFFFAQHDYKQLPEGNTLFFLVGLPAVLFMMKSPLEMVLHNRKHPNNPHKFTVFSLMNFSMDWLVEMLEIFSGYLANTLSFMRVAGLGIAHVSLMMAFDQISKMVTGGVGGFNIWSILIIVAGNILVIGLEGLSAGIQSLRLNYYEFFSKYFSGTGKAYAPIALKGNS